MADKYNIPKGKMHSNCGILSEDIVCKITQGNNIRRANTCDPVLKLLNEEITSDIHKKADWTQFTEGTESAFTQTTIPINIHTANIIFTNMILMADKYNIPKGKMHSNCRLLSEDIVGRPVKFRAQTSKEHLCICDPYAKMVHRSCFGTKSIFDDERHCK